MDLQTEPTFSAVEAAAQEYDAQRIANLCKEIQQIPAPTGTEEARSVWVQAYLHRVGVSDVERDEVLNVYGRIPGVTSTPALLVSAHTDTVFPLETDLSTTQDAENDRIAGPGIGDNATGVAGLLALAETLVTLPPPPVDIWLVANSNEEGLGDLRGMRAAVDRLQDRLGAVIVVEGMGLGRIVHRALGVRRYRISAAAPGGHSWGDFGVASAIHALVELATDITRLKVPNQPRTSFNIGRISGGTSVNTIAQAASLQLDLRSEMPDTLDWLDNQVQAIVERYTRKHRRRRDGVRFDMEPIGNRPAGGIEPDHPLIEKLSAVLAYIGVTERPEARISSTDANIPLSRGIPAVCIGLTEGGDAHRPSEWIDTRPLAKGMQQLLFFAWWTAVWLTGGEAAATQ